MTKQYLMYGMSAIVFVGTVVLTALHDVPVNVITTEIGAIIGALGVHSGVTKA